MVASSFFPGHHAPAPTILSPPGFTRNKTVSIRIINRTGINAPSLVDVTQTIVLLV
jgi:hypothetical protein